MAPTDGPSPPTAQTTTRRQFLGRFGAIATIGVGVGAGAGVLSGCGLTPRRAPLTAPTVVPLFSPDRVLAAGRPQRIPLAIVDPGSGQDRVVMPRDGEAITIDIALGGDRIDRVEVAGRVVDHDHVGPVDPDHQHADLFRYYPLRATLPQPGIYDLAIGIEGPDGIGNAERVTTTIPIQAFDPAEVALPLAGDPFPAITTPTIDDPGGIDRLCTRYEPCPLHQHDAADLVGAGRPLALLVATPAFCSTAYCGPVLDTLLEAVSDASAAGRDLDAIHVEVYANPDEVDGNFADPAIRLIPAVERLGLTFEPSLFLVSADGTLVDRIDNVFDRSELDEALAQLTG